MDVAQRFELIDYSETGRSSASQGRVFLGRISLDGQLRSISGRGNGLISSVASALRDDCGLDLDVVDYPEHAMSRGSDAEAAAYVECRTPDGRLFFGIGIDAVEIG